MENFIREVICDRGLQYIEHLNPCFLCLAIHLLGAAKLSVRDCHLWKWSETEATAAMMAAARAALALLKAEIDADMFPPTEPMHQPQIRIKI